MNLVDRYLLFLFFKIFTISLISFTGLFIVIHLSTNLDELVLAGEESAGGFGAVLWEFYSPRVLDIFDRSAGILVLLSAIFALGLVERRREMVAIQSAGVPKSRLVRPVLVGAIAILLLAVVNREFWMPKFKEKLALTPQTWLDSGSVPMPFQKDSLTGIVIHGDELVIRENKITSPDVQIPLQLDSKTSTIRSATGTIELEKPHRPAGLLLRNVSLPEDISDKTSIAKDDKTLIYFPGDIDWLEPNQCFVVCNLDASEIAFGKQMNRYATLPEMMANLRKPRRFFGHSQQIEVHARILKPLLDLSLLLLGLPMVIGRVSSNIFTSAAFCLGIVVLVQVTTIVCQSLGSVSLIRPAALAVWLPVLLFLPLGLVSMRRLVV